MTMAYSMTGYARAGVGSDEFSVVVAIRSVNHRSLDLKLRVPTELNAYEALVRRKIREHVHRGSLQVTIEFDLHGQPPTHIDRGLIQARLDALRQIADLCGVKAHPDPNMLLHLPGSFVLEQVEIPHVKLEPSLLQALNEALLQLNASRAEEGCTLIQDITSHTNVISAEVEELFGTTGRAAERGKHRLEQRLQELLGGVDIEPQRLVQEAAVLASRSDISEELQRLRSHLIGLRRCLEDTLEIGKKIDFLAQEMYREANTLLSKIQPLGRDALDVTESGLRIKAAVEKIREQASNLQ